MDPRELSRSATTASSSAISGQTADSHPVVCGAGAGTCTKSVQKRRTLRPHQHAATASYWKEKNHIPPTIGAAGTQRKSCLRRNLRELSKLHREGCSPQTALHQVSLSRRRSEVARHNISHKHSKFQLQADPQQRKRVSQLLQSLNDQVNQFVLKM
jgi:hypothetical protein